MFTANRSRPSSSSNERAQLLVIVSDGRVMSEGPDKVKQAVRRAKQSGIFMVFVIVDNPESKVTTFKMLPLVTPDNRRIEISFYS
jgi:midasin